MENRDIIKCVKGFHSYLKRSSDSTSILTIIGDSVGNELKEIRQYINCVNDLNKRIICLGRLPHNELNEHFINADIGISFIPITKWYNFQPPTKTFEYLLSGLPVIATKTFENINILKEDKNSILIEDSEADFDEAVNSMVLKSATIHFYDFNGQYDKFKWKVLVEDIFIP